MNRNHLLDYDWQIFLKWLLQLSIYSYTSNLQLMNIDITRLNEYFRFTWLSLEAFDTLHIPNPTKNSYDDACNIQSSNTICAAKYYHIKI
jgi:hypothetical protein